MPLDRFLIAPLNVGLENDIRPWLIPDSAYEQLNNVYMFRGRIRKRFGSRYMIPTITPPVGFEQYPSRLRVLSATTTTGAAWSNGGVALPGTVFQAGQIFTVGPWTDSMGNIVFNIFTVISNTPGAQPMLRNDTPVGANVATFDVATGMVVITNISSPLVPASTVPNGTAVYWYPSLPVMGLIIWETLGINNQPTIAFDTQFAYQFTATGWERLDLETVAGDAIWTGTNSQFFWGYTYQGLNLSQNFLFVTNFNGNENNYMRYLDNTSTWNLFAPITATTAGNIVVSARIIVGFHDHLVLLNTIEDSSVPTIGNGVNFKNRARYCSIGSPIDDTAAAPQYLPWIDNKNDPNFRGGGFVDNLQTQEEIVSAEFIKDRLIVYYARETWELVYTGNQQIPFVWQQINTEFGSQSTFSKVPFDTEVLAIAQNGITSCSGANVERIDQKIPDNVFDIRNDNDGVLRVQGIRDFKAEQVYWTLPLASKSAPFAQIYPNQVLVYNYMTQSWAYNTDSFTAFGFFTQQPSLTWGSISTLWQNMTQTWADGSLQANFRQILGGNQEGYVTIIDPDLTRNAGALQITNATFIAPDIVELTIINHNLVDQDILTNQEEFILIENIAGNGSWTLLNGIITPIVSITGVDTIRVRSFPITAGDVYIGSGTVTRVSNINILSKQWNPYVKSGQNVFIQKMNFLVSRTGGVDSRTGTPYGGEVTVDYYPSTSKYSMLKNSVPGSLISNGILETRPYNPIYYPFEAEQDRLWHPQYLAVDGNAIQIRIFMTNDQIINPNNSLCDFQLHAIILEAMPGSFRIGG